MSLKRDLATEQILYTKNQKKPHLLVKKKFKWIWTQCHVFEYFLKVEKEWKEYWYTITV